MQSRINKKVFLSIFLVFFIFASLAGVYGAVTGLSSATIQSNFFDFDKAWVIDFISDDFTTDTITAFFTPDDFERESGTETKQSLTVSAETSPNLCQWSLKEDISSRPDVFLYAPLHLEDWRWNLGSDNFRQYAKDNGCADTGGFGDDFYFKLGLTRSNIYCVKVQQKLGTIGNFVGEKIITQTDWEITAEGKSTQRATITNDETGSGRSSPVGDRVWIQWQGNADTGESCPLTQDARPVHSNSFANGWRIGSEGNYDSYKNYIESQLTNDLTN